MDSSMKLTPGEEISQRVQRICLIGKLISDNTPLTSLSVKSLTSMEWRCKKEFKVSFIQRNMFLFTFQDEEDSSRVLRNTPYRIRGVLLVLSPWISAKFPSELQFSCSPFWVQVHGLPFIYFTKENRIKIAELLGKPVCIDGDVMDDGNLTWRRYLRIRVILDIGKPLLPGFWQKRPGLTDTWICFKYEKLGVFCYKCGRIGKHFNKCESPEGKGCFGPWMRAEPLVYNNPGGWPWRGRGGASSAMVVRNAAPMRVGGGRFVEENGNRFASLVNMDEIVGTLVTPADGTEATEKVESEEMLCSGNDNDVSYSFLLQKLFLNTISAVIIIANCIIITSRVAAAKDEENNWSLLVLVAAFLFYLVISFVHTIRRTRLSANAPFRHAIREILVLLLVFVLLII